MKQWLRKWLGALSIEDVLTISPDFGVAAEVTEKLSTNKLGTAEVNIDAATKMLAKANADKAEANKMLEAVKAFRTLHKES